MRFHKVGDVLGYKNLRQALVANCGLLDIDIQDAETQDNEEFLLEAGGDESIDVDAVLPQVKNSEDSMAIDEEGRPKFAPARDIVRSLTLQIL